MVDENLIGIGLYTPAEASRLVGVSATRITRWLRGHDAGEIHYERLWRPQIDLDDGHVYLGFRDLMEVRVADAFITQGLSAQRVRRAIELARELVGDDRPLSTTRFRTDGRTVFLQALREDGEDDLIDLFKGQYAFRRILEPSLRNIEFDGGGLPSRWWPQGKSTQIVVDPERAFGRPIDAVSGVPAEILALAAEAEGSQERAARTWAVPLAVVRRAVKFQRQLDRKAA